MTEAVDTKSKEKNDSGAKLAKIQPLKKERITKDTEALDIETVSPNENIELEKSLIHTTRMLLRHYGIRKSGAAVRDAIGTSHLHVGPKEAVSALSNIGFKASFGRLNIRKLSEEFFPLIAFTKNGDAVLVNYFLDDEKISISRPSDQTEKKITFSDYSEQFSEYVIIAKELNNSE